MLTAARGGHNLFLRRGLAGLALAVLAGSAHAQNFIFGNQCGDGQWFTSCNPSANLWRNNWGRTGLTQVQLAFPQAEDTVLLAGTVLLSGNTAAASITVPTGTTFNWAGGTISCPLVTSTGLIQLVSSDSKFLSGNLTNAPLGSVRLQAGTFFLSPTALPSVLGNDGLLLLEGGTSLRRNGSTLGMARLENRGQVQVQGGPVDVLGVAVIGQPASTINVAADASLNLTAAAIGGTLGGTLNGPVTFSSGLSLITDTTLSLAPASGSAWTWTGGDILCNGLTLTSTGKLTVNTPGNKFLYGAILNTPAGEMVIDDGTLFLSPETGPASLTNQGTLALRDDADLRRMGGSRPQAVFNNSGVVDVQNGTEFSTVVVTDVTLTGSGTWRTGAGTALILDNLDLGATLLGDHAGTAQFSGTINLTADTLLGATGAGTQPWRWNAGSFIAGPHTLSVTGRLAVASISSKFFTGRLLAGSGGVVSIDAGPFFLAPGGATSTLEVAPGGMIELSGEAAVQRNSGLITEAVLHNDGQVMVTTGGATNTASVTGVSISGNGLWTTQATSTLFLADNTYRGRLTGNHQGWALISGTSVLTGNTTLASSPASENPWRWNSGTIDTGPYTLALDGRLNVSGAGSRVVTGRLSTSAGSVTRLVDGTILLVPPVGGQTVLVNSGTFRLGTIANVLGPDGNNGNSIFRNFGTIEVEGAFARIGLVSLQLGGSAVIRVPASRGIELPASYALSAGRLEGGGTVLVQGGMNNNGGTVAPGDDATPGTMSMPLGYQQSAGGSLEVTLVNDGSSQTTDHLNILGIASLNGVLRVNLPAGSATPLALGEHLVLTAAGGRFGTFSAVTADASVPGKRYQLRYTATEVFLQVVAGCNSSDVGGQGGVAGPDGVLDNNDFVVFIDSFFTLNPVADVGRQGGLAGSDGLYNNDDFVVFIDVFFGGCG